MEQNPLTVHQLLNENRADLRLHLTAGREGVHRPILEKDLHRPGLFLSGFEELFPSLRIQILGNTENLYLRKLSDEQRSAAIKRLFIKQPPCLILTNKNRAIEEMVANAENYDVPLIRTPLSTNDVTFLLASYLARKFAASELIHGTLVDVYGTGLLLIGRAGIGKSEIALDLVERGHRLVADDVVQLRLMPPAVLLGSGPELLKHFIEIRGVGVINVREVFGVGAVRVQKRVEVVVELVDWDNQEEYERLGILDQYRTYLGQKVPLIKLPIYPGKNITVIVETIALNLHLKIYGYHAGKALNHRLITRMRDSKRIRDYLKWDYE